MSTNKKDIVFVWGWITTEGNRLVAGSGSSAKPSDVAGIWGSMTIGTSVTYNEVWLNEYQVEGNKTSWELRPMAMLIKTCYEQTYNLACVSRKNVLFESEVFATVKPISIVITKLQRWACKACGHTFYSAYLDTRNILARVRDLFKKAVVIECETCNKKSATRSGIKIVRE